MQWPVYLLAVFLAGQAMMEVGGAVWPVQPGSVSWRFASYGLMTTSLAPILTGLAIAMVMAAAAGQRFAVRTLGVIALGGAAVLLVGAGAFGLDAIQLRRQVVPDARGVYDVNFVQAGISGLLAVAYLLGVGWWGYLEGKAVGARRRARRRRRRAKGTGKGERTSGGRDDRPGDGSGGNVSVDGGRDPGAGGGSV